ncbi:CapA family protein [Cohnella suwonensis]|uniref:CapA family protein n=1 Tax=Cohnella suwonensis TaxID=696072 RepID=A0ABW0LPL9_9BACL
MIRSSVLAIAIGLSAFTLTACSGAGVNSPASPSQSATSSAGGLGGQGTPSAPADSGESASPTPEGPAVTEARLVAVGDIMTHSPQLPGYYDAATGKYDFSSWFAQVKPIFAEGDWVVANLETPIAGKDLKYTGYPRFNAPYELAVALKGAGVQLVSTANNHAMDRGFPGVERTLANVRKAGLVPFGTSATEAESGRFVIEERNGIRMGFAAYTYSTNGIPVPQNKSFAVNLIEPSRIKADIAKLKEAGADVVTVSLHFGIEYQRLPNEAQTTLVRDLVEAGADIVLGSHTHVVQPYDVIDVPAGESADGMPHRGLVIYSMGNFISNQTGNWKDVGLIFGVTLVKTRQADGTFATEWKNVTTEPTWVHIVPKNKKRYYTVIPIARALANRDDPTLTNADYANIKKMLNKMNVHLLKLRPKAG